MKAQVNLTSPSEVDKASELNGHDPTGGRSIHREMDTKLSGYEVEEILETGVALSGDELKKVLENDIKHSGDEMEEVLESAI